MHLNKDKMLKDENCLIEGLRDYHKILNEAILRQQTTTYIKVKWEKPKIVNNKNFVFLGVEETDPIEYEKLYGPTLVNNASDFLPEVAKHFPPPNGEVLAVDYNKTNSINSTNIQCNFSPRICNLNQFVQYNSYNYLLNESYNNYYQSNYYFNVYNQY